MSYFEVCKLFCLFCKTKILSRKISFKLIDILLYCIYLFMYVWFLMYLHLKGEHFKNLFK